MNRRWLNHSLLVLLAPAGLVARQDLLPREQEVTWGCGSAAVAPPGVHLPMAPAAGGTVAVGHLAVLVGALLALIVLVRLLRLAARALSDCLMPRRRPVAVMMGPTRAHASELPRPQQFLIGLSVIRRGPPAVA